MSEKKEEPTGPEKEFVGLPMYCVIVHNDDEHTYEEVTDTLVRIVRMSLPKASRATRAIDKNGLAVVARTHMELAELFVERFSQYGLKATMVPEVKT
jgi:ATP-dependent Clp protease adapter protein ClpS